MSPEEREEIKRRESSRRAEKRREAQELKKLQKEGVVPQVKQEVSVANVDRLPEHHQHQQTHPSPGIPQHPMELKPVLHLNPMGFPFAIDPNRSSFGNGYGGGY